MYERGTPVPFRPYWVHVPGLTESDWLQIQDEETEDWYLRNEGFYYRHRVQEERYQKVKIPSSIRWQVWERDNFTCKQCGTRANLSVDHIVPESKGGSLNLDNLQTLCKKCNSSKGMKVVFTNG